MIFASAARPILFIAMVAILGAPAVLAGNPVLPPDAQQGLEKLNSGDPDGAIALFRALQASAPDQPLGYLLEGEALWWKNYCASLEVKWGMVDAAKRGKQAGDDEYLALAEKTVRLAAAQSAKKDSAEMHLYAGLALALEARLYGMRERESGHGARRRACARRVFARQAARSANDRRRHGSRPLQLLHRHAFGHRQSCCASSWAFPAAASRREFANSNLR